MASAVSGGAVVGVHLSLNFSIASCIDVNVAVSKFSSDCCNLFITFGPVKIVSKNI